jgi:hypothetical protein
MTDDCGLLNLASCIPQKFFEFISSLVTAPLQVLLDFVKNYLVLPVDLSGFGHIWAVIIYILSMFYGLLLLYSGVNFIISGYDMVKREKAKEWFRNIIIMIVLVQMSYFIYATVIDINSLLTSGIVNMISPTFFNLTTDSMTGLGLQLLLGFFFMITALITTLLLVLRYIVVAVGVVLIPIAIFLYFVPPLREYGRMMLNVLATIIFVPFFDALILLAVSIISSNPSFSNFNIGLMIAGFSIINLFMFYIMIFSAIKSIIRKGEEIALPFVKIASLFA